MTMSKFGKTVKRWAAGLLGAAMLTIPNLTLAADLTWQDILDRYPNKAIQELAGTLDNTYYRTWQEAEEELAEQLMDMEIFAADGTQIDLDAGPARIATGQFGCFYHDDYPDGARLFVMVDKGDVTGSGKLDITQLVRMADALTDRKPLAGVYLLAGDIDSNGELNIVDLALLGRWLRRSMGATRTTTGPIVEIPAAE